MHPVDLSLIRQAGAPTIAPDGSRIVVAITRPDFATDSNVSLLREFACHGQTSGEITPGAGRLLTRGPADTQPAFSPDGTLLAFLRSAASRMDHTEMADAPQIHVVDARGGEALAITDLPLGVTSFRWLPDSAGIVCEAPVPVAGRYRPDIEPAAEPPRTLPGYRGRYNGRGYIFDRPHHLFHVPVAAVHEDPDFEPVGRAAALADGDDAERFEVALPRPTRLTSGDVGFSLTDVTSSGRHVLAIAGLHEDHDTNLRTDLFAIRVKTKGEDPDPPIAVTTSDGADVLLGVSGACPVQGGLFLSASTLGETGLDFVGESDAVGFVADDVIAAIIEGKREPLSHGDTDWAVLTDADTQRCSGSLMPYRDTNVLFGFEERGSTRLAMLDPDGTMSLLTEPGTIALGWVASGDGTIALSYADATSPGEVAIIAPDDVAAAPRVDAPDTAATAETSDTADADPTDAAPTDAGATSDGADATDAANSAETADAADAGSTDAESPTATPQDAPKRLRLSDFARGLRSTTILPAAERIYPSKDDYPVHGWVVLPENPIGAPVVLMIHGGPHAAYGPAVFDEAQVLASAGYAVVMCNPRGSSGYGREHGRAIRQALGTLDADDVLAFLDGVLAEFDQLDAERLGIMGGSYGGYLTAWIIAHDHRFRGAIVERAYLDPAAFVGPSDIGWFFSDEYVGTDPERVAAQSPMTFVDDVDTSCLVLHSEQDLRCPIEQALRYYTALKANGVDAKCVVFPGENHELSRSGRPWHRLDRFEEILGFWDEHLPQHT